MAKKSPLRRILIVILILTFGLFLVGWLYMIRVAPDVRRPTPNAASKTQIIDLERRLRGHLRVLADEIGPRNLANPKGLARARDYIVEQFAQSGRPSQETYEVGGVKCSNVVLELPGLSKRIVVIGAHYDTAPGTPGADDNATGVAALLEVARALKGRIAENTLRLVAFVNEEPPHYKTSKMGSFVYAQGCKNAGDDIVAMVSLEMLGSYSDEASSQRYPAPFGWFYPSTGNFLAVVGNLGSRHLVVRSLAHFMAASDFPVEGIATFESIAGIGSSDHWSFWRHDYPAVMLTDTAQFRNEHYHRASDTSATIDFASFARVTHGILGLVRGLTNEKS